MKRDPRDLTSFVILICIYIYHKSYMLSFKCSIFGLLFLIYFEMTTLCVCCYLGLISFPVYATVWSLCVLLPTCVGGFSPMFTAINSFLCLSAAQKSSNCNIRWHVTSNQRKAGDHKAYWFYKHQQCSCCIVHPLNLVPSYAEKRMVEIIFS